MKPKIPSVIQVNKISVAQLEKLNKAGVTVVIPKEDTQLKKLEHAAREALQRNNVKAAKSARLQMLKLIRGAKK